MATKQLGYNPVFLFSFFTVLFCFALLSIEGESHAWTSNSWTFLFFNIFWDITIIFMTYNIIFPRPIIGKLIIKSPYFFLYWSHKNSIQITWLSMSGKQDHENSITLQIFADPCGFWKYLNFSFNLPVTQKRLAW